MNFASSLRFISQLVLSKPATRNSSYKLLFVTMALFTILNGAANTPSDTLTIGIHLNPPFVIKNDHQQYEGLSIELWKNIAATTNIHFDYVEYADLIGILKALEYKEIDLTINPMYVNPQRVEKFDMTQPFFISSIGVVVPFLNRSPVAVFISNIFSLGFFANCSFISFCHLRFRFSIVVSRTEAKSISISPQGFLVYSMVYGGRL